MCVSMGGVSVVLLLVFVCVCVGGGVPPLREAAVHQRPHRPGDYRVHWYVKSSRHSGVWLGLLSRVCRPGYVYARRPNHLTNPPNTPTQP